MAVSLHKAETFLRNEGTAMLTMAEADGMPSLWVAMSEPLVNESRVAEAAKMRAEQMEANANE